MLFGHRRYKMAGGIRWMPPATLCALVCGLDLVKGRVDLACKGFGA